MASDRGSQPQYQKKSQSIESRTSVGAAVNGVFVKLAFKVLLLLLFCAKGEANPTIGTYRVFKSSQDLEIHISEDSAKLSGKYIFESEPAKASGEESGDARLGIPIWIPVNLIKSYISAESYKPLKSVADLDLKVLINKRTVECEYSFDLNKGDQEVLQFDVNLNLSGIGFEPGYKCVVFVYNLGPYVFLDGKNVYLEGKKLEISYKQPLLKRREDLNFFYLPIFEKSAIEALSKHPERYSIRISHEAGLDVELQHRGRHKVSEEKGVLMITPQVNTPIRLSIKKK
jgi:hypothetical protein